ncbi:MAG: DUF1553 domain-containing protein, partial [Planctomycetales bacterium]|nr:DUF1553 domain-containing protein [Planctomycetales bacterium]
TNEQRIATGFLRNNATTDEGGVIPEEYRVEYAVDRVKTTAVVWMGLTMECGQCHNHKYDPITQEDYYRFFAYFNQAADPGMQTRNGNQTPTAQVAASDTSDKKQQLTAELAAAEAALDAHKAGAQAAFLAWANEAAKGEKKPAIPEDVAVHLPLDDAQGDAPAVLLADGQRQGKVHGAASWVEGKQLGALRCDGSNFIDAGDVANFERTDAFSYGAWIRPPGGAGGAALARMDDGAAYRGFDLYVSGGRVSVHIIHSWPSNAVKVTTEQALKPDQWQHVFMTYDGSSKAAGITIYFDGVKQKWNIEQDGLRDTIRTEKTLYVGRRNPGSPFRGDIDDVRVYARQLSEAEVQSLAGSDGVAALLAKSPEAWSPEERAALENHYFHSRDKAYRQKNAATAKLRTQLAALDKPVSTVMVMQDVPQPRMTYILERGNYASPRKDHPVEPGVPSVLPPLPEDAPPNRLGLARWLVQPDHPLTARVAVNRYWHMLFGTGLVKTLEDFGSQGESPSHPELLDWLAVDFVEHGWDVKRTL